MNQSLSLSQIIDLYMKTSDSVSGLWNIYMAASFAAAGFAASSRLSSMTASVVTAGYAVFLGGHIALLCHAILIQNAVVAALPKIIEGDKSPRGLIVSAIYRSDNVMWQSLTIHAAIDLCVIALIWNSAWRTKRKAKAAA